MLGDELTHAILGDIARPSDARRLEERCLRRDVRIEPAGGSGYQVDWHRRRGVLLLQLVEVALDALDERLVGRAEVRAHGVGCIVRRVDRLGRILGIGRIGGRRSPVEVFVVGEGLPDQHRADDFAVLLDHTAIGLRGEKYLCQAGHDQRVR